MNKSRIFIVLGGISFFIFVLHSGLRAFPLTGGNKLIYQDVHASGGMVGRTGGSFYMEDDVIGQPALVGSSYNVTRFLSHGYLGGGSSGISVSYIRSTILTPQADTFVDQLAAVLGRVLSPVQVRDEQITLQRMADGLYFNGREWQEQEIWLTCNGNLNWDYPISDDKSIFTYGQQYRISARATDVTGAIESSYPSLLFTFVFSTDFKGSVCNYPNPFYPDSSDSTRNYTTIEYFLSSEKIVKIYIFAVNGEAVKSWSGIEYNRAGLHRIRWDGRSEKGSIVGNGVYMLVVDIGSQKVIEKISVIR
ncbi:MAG: T9SS type A sorting domain-containing protein [bacterium]|nr:T9SS type A sorting domain-containing protein [bacterium]